MKKSQQRLDFPVVHGAMLQVKPDAIETVMGGMANVSGNEMT